MLRHEEGRKIFYMEITWKNSNGQMKFIMCHTKIKITYTRKISATQQENIGVCENKLTHKTN